MVNVTGGGNAIATPRDLKAFLNQQGNDTTRLLGKKDAHGNIQLYTSNKRASLFQRVTGQAANRRANAREAVNQVMGHHERKASARGMGSQGSRALFGNVKARFAANDKHALRSGDVKSAFQTTKAVVGMLPKAGGAPAPAPVSRPGPHLAETGLTERDFAPLTTDLAGFPQTEPEPSADFLRLATSLGDRISTGFGQAHAGAPDRERFSLSTGQPLRGQLKTEIKTALTRAAPQHSFDDAQLDLFVAKAFNRAAQNLSPSKAVAGTGTTIGKFSLQSVNIQGTVYNPTRFISKGSFGYVYEYKAANGDTIALKTLQGSRLADKFNPDVNDDENTHEAIDKAIDDAVVEINAHKSAAGSGHPNVITPKGTIRMADGTLAIAMEFAPHGTAFELAEKITAAIGTGPGKISAEQANALRLTMLKDMAQGLRHVRDQGMIHLDFKSPNCMVGQDGAIKVADFGTTRQGDDIAATDIPAGIDNPRWQAPEMIYRKEVLSNERDVFLKRVNADRRDVTDRVANLLPNATDDDKTALTTDVAASRSKVLQGDLDETVAQLRVNMSVDTWGLGIAAIDLFHGVGSGLAGQTWNHKMQEAVIDFGSKPGNVALAPASHPADQPLPTGTLAPSTGVSDADALVNRMLSPVPDSRPSLDQIINSAALTSGGVGSDEAHALLVALSRGDASSIDTHKTGLDAVLR